MFIKRTAEKTFLKLLRQYPVVAVTGPRQSGKTTLVRHACPDKPYVLLEDLDVRQFAQEDPRGFLGMPGNAGSDQTNQLISFIC